MKCESEKQLPAYEFIHRSYYGGKETVRVTVDPDGQGLADLCDMFGRFLRGCGFCLDGGDIEFVIDAVKWGVVDEDINQPK